MHPTGRFEKIVESFSEGLCDLMDISFSVTQSVRHGLEDLGMDVLTTEVQDKSTGVVEETCFYYSTISPEMVIAACAINSTGGEYGPPCGITEFTGGGCEYMTSRGVIFGFELVDEYPRYRFWIIHPDAGMRSDNSSLRKSAIEQGWTEVIAEETRFHNERTEHRHPPDYNWHPINEVHGGVA